MEVQGYAPPRAPLVDPSGAGRWLDVPADLGPFGVLTRSLTVFAENFSPILGVYAVVYVPYEVATLTLTFGGFSAWGPSGVELAFGWVSFGLDALAGPAVLMVLLARARTPEAEGLITASLRWALRRWWAVLSATTVATVLIWLGLLCTIVPGVILAVRYAVLTPVAALEEVDAPRTRSAALAAGQGWCVLGTLLLTHPPVYLVTLVLANLLSPRHEWYPTVHTWYFTLAFDLLRLGTSAFLSVCALVLYLSLRQRAEPGWPPAPELAPSA